ncbi:hypothetical protein ACFPT7_01990 [Acidicapsa dinghuensis]|uniref:Uncharacterized protein n=1 Tax=Acidicapsa dinghuensis TaxID=2218256 RepID=A0ABW1ECS1_9BACT|nr:hypothetical protein [Acidicapsa dinghuensis]
MPKSTNSSLIAVNVETKTAASKPASISKTCYYRIVSSAHGTTSGSGAGTVANSIVAIFEILRKRKIVFGIES